MPINPTAIRTLPLFAGLDSTALDAIASISTLETMKSGDRPLEAGRHADHLYLLLSGQVAVGTTGSDGEFVAVEFLGPGDFFGTPAVLLGRPSLMAAEVVESSRIVCVAADEFRQMLRADPSLSMQMLESLATSYRTLVRHVADLTSRSVAQRLGCFLLSLQAEQKAAQIVLPVEKRLVASRLGTTPESLSRAFSVLRTCGVVTNGRKVSLRNLPALARFARPDQPY